jgi:aerobic-type carbon monoxide dehydrogenase small subunit (CoxS/CutS family)
VSWIANRRASPVRRDESRRKQLIADHLMGLVSPKDPATLPITAASEIREHMRGNICRCVA